MSFAKIRFKLTGRLERTGYELANELLFADVTIKKVELTGDTVLVFLGNKEQWDEFLTSHATDKLAELNLKVIPDQAHRARKTIFIPRLPSFICNAEPENIIDDINSNNPDLIVTHLHFVGNSKRPELPKTNAKITFETVHMADVAFTNGFKIGKIDIEPDFFEYENYVEVQQCFKCFSYEHVSIKCKESQQFCNKCSGPHHYKACDSENIQCKNCQESHFSTAPFCSVRKEHINNLKEEKNKAANDQQQTHDAPLPKTNPWEAKSNETINAQFPPLNKQNPTTSQSVNNQNNANGNTSTVPPTASSSTCNHDCKHAQSNIPAKSLNEQLQENEWSIHYSLWNKIANKIAGNDTIEYVTVMNAFLEQHNLSQVQLPPIVTSLIHKQVNKNSTTETNSQAADDSISQFAEETNSQAEDDSFSQSAESEKINVESDQDTNSSFAESDTSQDNTLENTVIEQAQNLESNMSKASSSESLITPGQVQHTCNINNITYDSDITSSLPLTQVGINNTQESPKEKKELNTDRTLRSAGSVDSLIEAAYINGNDKAVRPKHSSNESLSLKSKKTRGGRRN